MPVVAEYFRETNYKRLGIGEVISGGTGSRELVIGYN